MDVYGLTSAPPDCKRVSQKKYGASNVSDTVTPRIVRPHPFHSVCMATVIYTAADDIPINHYIDWNPCPLLFVRFPLVLSDLRPSNDEAPKISQKPNPTGNLMQPQSFPRNDYAHLALLPGGGHGLLPTI